MTFGILEDHKLDIVPGTGLLSAKPKHLAAHEAHGLKTGTGKYSHIVLIPQPSDDPCDPLNWPKWKKETCFWILVFTSSVADTLWTLASPAYVQLAKQFHVSVDEIASSFSGNVLGIATFTLVQNALAVKFGHRIVYLLSTLLMFVSCIWTALSPNLASLRASRVFQGFGEAAPKCLTAVTIEHLFFVHERGTRSCIWSLFLVSSSIMYYTGSLINSHVIQFLPWQLGFWFVSIACGLSLVGVFFLVPETTYRREATPDHGTKPTDMKDTIGEDNDENMPRILAISDVNSHGGHIEGALALPSKVQTFLSQFKVYNGRFSGESIWKIFLRSFPFVLSPVTWFVFLGYCMPTILLTLVPLCASTIFTIEYGFNTSQVGLTNIGALVGVILALLITRLLNDSVVLWMSRHNCGRYEPEYRLVFMPSMLFGVFGYVGWAVGNDHHMPWIGAVSCIGLIYFSLVITGGTTLAYLIDTHGASATHVIALNDFTKGMISYSMTFVANGIVVARGVKVSLLILGACQAGCLLLVVPMYVYGKRVRSFIARHPRLFRKDLPAPDLPQSAAGSQIDSKR